MTKIVNYDTHIYAENECMYTCSKRKKYTFTFFWQIIAENVKNAIRFKIKTTFYLY